MSFWRKTMMSFEIKLSSMYSWNIFLKILYSIGLCILLVLIIGKFLSSSIWNTYFFCISSNKIFIIWTFSWSSKIISETHIFLFRTILRNYVHASNFVTCVIIQGLLSCRIIDTSREKNIAIFYYEDIFRNVKIFWKI